jgi:signal peptidase I
MSTTVKAGEGDRAGGGEAQRKETPFEAVASICSVLVVGLFILRFLAQNFVIPSGSTTSISMRGWCT